MTNKSCETGQSKRGCRVLTEISSSTPGMVYNTMRQGRVGNGRGDGKHRTGDGKKDKRNKVVWKKKTKRRVMRE